MGAVAAVPLAVVRDLMLVLLRLRADILAENLFLRRQLARYQERKARRGRPTPAAKLALVLLSRFFGWEQALAIVKPATFVRWPGPVSVVMAVEITTVRTAANIQEPAQSDHHHG